MNYYKKEWLQSLKDVVPKSAYGDTVAKYSIALEGWKRGLTLSFINQYYPTKKKSVLTYTLSSKHNKHKFALTRGDKVKKEAIKICMNKEKTKKVLKEANVPVPNGKFFNEKVSDENIIREGSKLGFPLVLKPVDGQEGKGVVTNINSEVELKNALQDVKYKQKFKKLILESHFFGEEYRAYVVNDKVVGAYKKEKANVIGDGKTTIRTLIKKKNKIRRKSIAFHSVIKVDTELLDTLKEQNYDLGTVPEKNEKVYLKKKNNISSGGDPIDATNELSNYIKSTAIKAVDSIPGLVQAGVDILIDKNQEKCVILEVNSKAGIATHLFPMKGIARDIPRAIIDYYFPETIYEGENFQPDFYFDYQFLRDLLANGAMKEITIQGYPKGEFYTTQFQISGKLSNVNYEKWVQRKAGQLQLHGNIEYSKGGVASVIVSGKQTSIERFREIINNESPKRAKVESVEEKHKKVPIKIGFEIIND